MWNPLHSQGGGGVKCEVCRKAQSWGPLGFVAEIKVRSNSQNASGIFAGKDYHAVLKVILQSVAAINPSVGFYCTLCLNCSCFDVKKKIPNATIIRDAMGNNSYSAHLNSSLSKQNYCECFKFF